MDNDFGYIQMYLQDINGITVSSTNYKVANGAKIWIPVKSYPIINMTQNINSDGEPSVVMKSTDSYMDRFGKVQYTGYNRPTITLDALIPIDEEVLTRAQYAAVANTSIVSCNFYLLFMLGLINHRYYLTDIRPGTVKPALGLPINILTNKAAPYADLRNDIFGNEIFSTNGVPVIIKSIQNKGKLILNDNISADETVVMEVKIELMVDFE